jgi:hypothetical protein
VKRQTHTNAFPTEIDPQVSLSKHSAQVPIRATLVGSDCCEALGVTARGSAPVLALCRVLVAAGHDPRRSLHVFRGEVLALVVRSIGDGAGLRVATHGVGFERIPECTGGSRVQQNGQGVPGAVPSRILSVRGPADE